MERREEGESSQRERRVCSRRRRVTQLINDSHRNCSQSYTLAKHSSRYSPSVDK